MIGKGDLLVADLIRRGCGWGFAPLLKEGELSVGVSIDVIHTAATPPGVQVTAEAKFIGMEGKMYLFEVTASDPGGSFW